MIKVTMPSRSMRMKAFGASPGARFDTAVAALPTAFSDGSSLRFDSLRSHPGRMKPTSSPPPAAAPTRRKRRRDGDTLVFASSFMNPMAFSLFGRGDLDRGADTSIGTAATDIAGHGIVDIGIGRLRRSVQQRGGGHHLTGLTVAALDHV